MPPAQPPPVWLPLLFGLIGVLAGGLLSYLFARLGKRQDRRSEWYDTKDRLDQETTARLNQFQWKHEDLQRWRDQTDKDCLSMQRTMNTLEHKLEMADRRVSDMAGDVQKARDHEYRLKFMEESLETLRQVINQSMIDMIKSKVR